MTTIYGLSRASARVQSVSDESAADAVAVVRPLSICIDPINPSCYYIGNQASIQYCSGDAGITITTLIAGVPQNDESVERWFADGVGSDARLNVVLGLLCTQNGDALYFADSKNQRIRVVNTKTRAVSTPGDGLKCQILDARKLVFDRSATVKPESALFITAYRAVRRFDLETGQVSSCRWRWRWTGNRPSGNRQRINRLADCELWENAFSLSVRTAHRTARVARRFRYVVYCTVCRWSGQSSTVLCSLRRSGGGA